LSQLFLLSSEGQGKESENQKGLQEQGWVKNPRIHSNNLAIITLESGSVMTRNELNEMVYHKELKRGPRVETSFFDKIFISNNRRNQSELTSLYIAGIPHLSLLQLTANNVFHPFTLFHNLPLPLFNLPFPPFHPLQSHFSLFSDSRSRIVDKFPSLFNLARNPLPPISFTDPQTPRNSFHFLRRLGGGRVGVHL